MVKLSNFANIPAVEVAGSSNLPRTRIRKEVATPTKRGNATTQTLGENDPSLLNVDDDLGPELEQGPRVAISGEFAPVYMVLGMIMVALSIGAHTAKQQLLHSPGVRINKKKRESIPEVDDPDAVVGSADKFVNKSFLRKVAHIQDHDRVLSDPVRAEPFTRYGSILS
ncbi:hypothetical protein F0562_032306 [Nyssa sinensis]|uniref:Uncharacterized protein n=1 Tax=Nyssa sinensis TaxID=561372 RepID=A0A5J5AMP7_9ASTE|nr:hypothetical protein F0562_032306 [Nyssa sinensis]